MKKTLHFGLAVALGCLASGAFAETQQSSTTAYSVVINMPEKVDLPNGKSVMIRGRTHASVVNDKTGVVASQWCTGEQHPGAIPNDNVGAGYCTIFYDGGDILWVSYTGTAPDKPGSWTVMGGTGQFAGATGGGTTTMVSQRSDGYAWTSKSTGTITTK